MIEPHHRLIDACDLAQKRIVAHARKPVLLLGGARPRPVVDRLGLEADEVGTRTVGERGGGEHALEVGATEMLIPAADADDEPVGPESLPIEERCRVQPLARVEAEVLCLLREALHVDAERREEPGRDRPVGPGAVDLERAAVHEMHAAAELELVALRVAAEVIVIVEQQDAAARRGPGSVEMGGGQPADARPDDDEIVPLAGVAGRGDRGAVAQRVGCLEGTRMAAAQSREQWGVIIRGRLRCGTARPGPVHGARTGSERGACEGGGAESEPVEEITPCDRSIQAEVVIRGAHGAVSQRWVGRVERYPQCRRDRQKAGSLPRPRAGPCREPEAVYNNSQADWIYR